MGVDRLTRVNALLRQEIGELLFRVVTDAGFDLAAVTVTRVNTSRDLREARVYVSIRDHQNERDAMLEKLEKHRAEIQARINKDIGLKYTPRLHFELDESIEQGDHVLSVLSTMEREGLLDAADAAQDPKTPQDPSPDT